MKSPETRLATGTRDEGPDSPAVARHAWDPSPHFARPGDPLREAFAGRRPLVPWLGGEPVAAQALASTWAELRSVARTRSAVAYVHVPFCAGHCTFCGFYRNGAGHPSRATYHALVEAELRLDSERALRSGPPIEALYFGGGTPTELDASALASLIGSARAQLPLADGAEITLEARVLHCDVEKLRACIDAGVSRISVGVQSFDTDVRHGLGRRADSTTLLAFLTELRGLSRAALVIDLILGLPGQTMDVWRRDLETCLDLRPDGVDLYALSLHPGVPLFQMVQRGTCAPSASVGVQADMYATGVETLERAGWEQLTQAHFASSPRERNVYNRRIKAGVDCIAFGAGAGGTHAGFSYVIEPDLGTYEETLRRGERPLARLARRVPTYEIEGHVADGIERGRLDLAPIDVADRGFCARADRLLEQWRKAGLIERDGSSVAPTIAGRFWQSNLITGLIECIRAGETREGESS